MASSERGGLVRPPDAEAGRLRCDVDLLFHATCAGPPAERLDDDQIHIGPSDYVAWQNDNKVCFLRMEGRGFASAPLHLELRLSVEDSPNSAGVTIDAIRLCQIALDQSLSGALLPASAYYMKHPPLQMRDVEALEEIERFLSETASKYRLSDYERPVPKPIAWPSDYQSTLERARDKAV